MAELDRPSRPIEQINSTLQTLRRELSAIAARPDKVLNQEILESLRSARARLAEMQQLVATHPDDDLVRAAYNKDADLEDLLARLEREYDVENQAQFLETELPQEASDALATETVLPFADSENESTWQQNLDKLNDEVSRLVNDVAYSVGAREDLSKHRETFSRLEVALALLSDPHQINQGVNSITGASLRRERLLLVQMRLDNLRNIIGSPAAAKPLEASGTSTDTLHDWEVDSSRHPEFFRVEVTQRITGAEETLNRIEGDLKPGLDPFSSELTTMQAELETLDTELHELSRRAKQRIEKIRNNNADLDGNDKADLLEKQYLNKIVEIRDRLKKVKLKVWEARIPAIFPDVVILRVEIKAPDPAPTLSVRNRFIEWQNGINRLRRAIDTANQQINANLSDPELIPQQRDILNTQYLKDAVADLARREREAFTLWQANALTIHTELRDFNNALTTLEAGLPTDVETAATELRAALATFEEAITNGSLPGGPDYEGVYDTYRERAKNLLDSLEQLIKELDAHAAELTDKTERRKDITWFRERLDTMEGNFKGFDDAAQITNWNEIQKALREQKDILSPAELEEIEMEITARRFLHLNWMMMDDATNGDRMMEKLKPEMCEVSGDMLDYLCKMPGVGDAFRLYDRVWQGRVAFFDSVGNPLLISTENFQENSDTVHAEVARLTDPLAQKIAWRLQLSFLRPSEFDRNQVWAGGKDQFRETIHVLEFRWKYYNYDRTAGPPITLSTYFERADRVDPENPPVLILPAENDLPSYDPGWDLFPGFFHFTYVGETIEKDGHLKKKPNEMYTSPSGMSKIVDFAHAKYRNADGDLMIENMPWKDLDAQNLKRWYKEMKGVGFEIRHKIEEEHYSAKDMSREQFFTDMMSKWQYEESYLYGIRDLGGAAMRGDAAAKAQKDYYTEQFRQQWLAGVVYVSFSAPPEGRDNWSMNDLRDVLKAATDSHFITKESATEIRRDADLWGRAALRIGRKIAERVADPFKQA